MKTLGELALRQVPVVEPSTALDEAIRLMRDEPLQTIVLVGDEQFMGVFNEEALESHQFPADADLTELPVGPYVHPVRMVGDPSTAIVPAREKMDRYQMRVLPVATNGVFYRGVLTRADLG